MLPHKYIGQEEMLFTSCYS